MYRVAPDPTVKIANSMPQNYRHKNARRKTGRSSRRASLSGSARVWSGPKLFCKCRAGWCAGPGSRERDRRFHAHRRGGIQARVGPAKCAPMAVRWWVRLERVIAGSRCSRILWHVRPHNLLDDLCHRLGLCRSDGEEDSPSRRLMAPRRVRRPRKLGANGTGAVHARRPVSK
jgi:hypothetical protein